ncbi:MAG: hypothetical protein P8J89_10965 [Phycisphaerales bacterium]|nr:hypothetical protein [Phycisphaerales bacterium]
MIFELAHTSTPQGLEPGSTGYATVVRTSGMPNHIRRLLEGMSAYRADGTPPMAVCGIRKTRTAGHPITVASLITPYGTDHSGRANRLAWHLAYDEATARQHPPSSVVQWLVDRAEGWNGKNATTSAPELEQINTGETPPHQPDPVLEQAWIDALGNHAIEPHERWVGLPPGTNLVEIVLAILSTIPEECRHEASICSGIDGTARELETRLILVNEESKAHQRLSAGVGRDKVDLSETPPKAVTRPAPELESVRKDESLRNKRTVRETETGSRTRTRHDHLFEEKASKPSQEQDAEDHALINQTSAHEHPPEEQRSSTRNLLILAAVVALAAIGLFLLTTLMGDSP